MTLIFVYAEENYSAYRDAHGEEVLLAHGPGFRRVIAFTDLDIGQRWADFLRGYGRDRYRFIQSLKDATFEPECVDDEVVWCEACEQPGSADCYYGVNNGWACETCDEDYYTCEDCEERYRHTTTTLHDTEVCESCRDNYNFCETCDGYYQRDSDDHNHNCSCESPAFSFTVRNDGEAPLDNDERVTVTLPAGVISDEGVGEIARYLRATAGSLDTDAAVGERLYALSYRLDDIGSGWQTRDGNFTKRLSRFAYQTYEGLKITPEMLSKIGNIASDHARAVAVHLEVTRDLNLGADEFYHDDSCWWGSHRESRCAFKNNGGFGLRTFSGDFYGSVTGRAWVLPLKTDGQGNLCPTFETQAPEAFVVFNGYGDLTGYAPARIVAHMAGWTYRKINFSCSPMYVNSDSGYIVAPEEIAEPFTDGSLSLHTTQHSSLYQTEKEALANVA